MRRIIRFAAATLGALGVLITLGTAWALTPEQVISLKNAGVSDQTIQLMIRQEQEAAAGSPVDSPGRKEVTDKDGKPVVLYSTGRGSPGKEEKQTEKAWEMLNNLIIDTRKSR